jgi:hypothetical protein
MGREEEGTLPSNTSQVTFYEDDMLPYFNILCLKYIQPWDRQIMEGKEYCPLYIMLSNENRIECQQKNWVHPQGQSHEIFHLNISSRNTAPRPLIETLV